MRVLPLLAALLLLAAGVRAFTLVYTNPAYNVTTAMSGDVIHVVSPACATGYAARMNPHGCNVECTVPALCPRTQSWTWTAVPYAVNATSCAFTFQMPTGGTASTAWRLIAVTACA